MLHLKLAFAVWNLGSFLLLLWTRRTNLKTFLKVSGILFVKMTYSTESSNKRNSCKISSIRILYVPNIYLINFHAILRNRRFHKDEVLMFYSAIMADLDALEELRKTSIKYVMSVRLLQLLYKWRYFYEIRYLIIYRKSI